MIKVRVEELINEITETERNLQSAKGYRKKDLNRHLSKLYKQMDEFRFYAMGGCANGRKIY